MKKKNTCKPRKRTAPTKSEKRLAKRQHDYDLMVEGNQHKYRGYRRPGSFNK